MAARLLGKLRPGVAKGGGCTKAHAFPAEEPDWVVGGRYELLREADLCGPLPESGKAVGSVPANRAVLLLALHRTSAVGPEDRFSLRGEVVHGFLADTSRLDWICGWAQLSGPAKEGGSARGPLAARRRCKGSWEVGGRYRVTGSLALRDGIELDSDEVHETRRGEEALLLDLGLHMVPSSSHRGSSSCASPREDEHDILPQEPRLRAQVRVDSGKIGWLTVELPGGRPLLDTVNLFSADALQTRSSVFRTRVQRTRKSANPLASQGGSRLETWEVGGKYRALAALVLRQESEVDSQPLGSVRVGDLVLVHEKTEVKLASQTRPKEVRLRVSATEASSCSPSLMGWVSCTRKSGELLIDVRDHLEFYHVTGEDPPPPVGSLQTLQYPEPESPQADEVRPERLQPQDCLACGGAGCGMCVGGPSTHAPPEAAQDSAPLASAGAAAEVAALECEPSSGEGGGACGTPLCLACGGQGCSMCSGRPPWACEHDNAGEPSATPLAADLQEEGSSPLADRQAAALDHASPSMSVAGSLLSGRLWHRRDSLPVEAVGGSLGSSSPSRASSLAWSPQRRQDDWVPDAPSCGPPPLGEPAAARLQHGAQLGSISPRQGITVRAQKEEVCEVLPPTKALGQLSEPPGNRSAEADEWRPFGDPRVELEAPELGCPTECHGGGLFGWGGSFLSCGGSRLMRPAKGAAYAPFEHERPTAVASDPPRHLGEPMPEPMVTPQAHRLSGKQTSLRDWLLV